MTEDSGTQETAGESERAADESPEVEYSDHAASRDTYELGKPQEETPYRNNSRKTAAKKAGKSRLEKVVSESDAGDYRAESQNTKLSLNLAEYAEAAHSADSDEDKDKNAAVTIICYRDKQTGELEFLFEQKPLDHPEASGKLSLVGGRIQRNEKSLEALVRELREEIQEPAASIVIESLGTNPHVYQRLSYEYGGIKGYSDIYVIEIMQESRWNAVKHAAFMHDAGSPRVLRQDELRIDDFAFGYGEIVKKFADDKFGRKKSAHFPHSGSSYIDSFGSKISNSFNYAGSAHLAQFSSEKITHFPHVGSAYLAPSPSFPYSPKSPLAGLQIAA